MVLALDEGIPVSVFLDGPSRAVIIVPSYGPGGDQVSKPASTGQMAAEATMKVFILMMERPRQQADLGLRERWRAQQLEATFCVLARQEVHGFILHPGEVYIITIAGP
jgi:hypothetical protein